MASYMSMSETSIKQYQEGKAAVLASYTSKISLKDELEAEVVQLNSDLGKEQDVITVVSDRLATLNKELDQLDELGPEFDDLRLLALQAIEDTQNTERVAANRAKQLGNKIAKLNGDIKKLGITPVIVTWVALNDPAERFKVAAEWIGPTYRDIRRSEKDMDSVGAQLQAVSKTGEKFDLPKNMWNQLHESLLDAIATYTKERGQQAKPTGITVGQNMRVRQ